jgi:hypothetical protein
MMCPFRAMMRQSRRDSHFQLCKLRPSPERRKGFLLIIVQGKWQTRKQSLRIVSHLVMLGECRQSRLSP